MDTIPPVGEEELRRLVGERSFERGRQYFHDGMIFDTRRQGMTLKARCEGSGPEPYRVQVAFNEQGLSGAGCSCPVGGYCKHTAALLLTWQARPGDFMAVEELDAVLERRDKAQLIALIKQMLRQQPELEALLETPLPGAGTASTPADRETYRRQAETVFRRAGHEWGVEARIARDLLAITAIGAGFAAREDYRSAALVYEGVLDAVLERYGEYHDEGELGGVVRTCVEELGECLAAETGDASPEEAVDVEARAEMVRALFDVYRYDMDLGGIGLAEEAPRLLIEYTTRDEREQVAGWVRAALPQGSDWIAGYRREHYGGFLLDLEGAEEGLDDEAFLRICRETGRTHDLIDRLLALSRLDDAVAATEGMDDYPLIGLADLFVAHGQSALAESIMRERAEKTTDTRVLEWLQRRAADRGDHAAALDLARKIFRMRPSLEGYREIRALANKRGRWEGLRPALRMFLKDAHQDHLLLEIYLDEGEIDHALDALKGLKAPSYGYGGYGGYGVGHIALKVARAAEQERPRAAIEIYHRQAEALIAQQGRANYTSACTLLARIRALYERLGEQDTWAQYIADVRERHRRLPALKQEMAAANL